MTWFADWETLVECDDDEAISIDEIPDDDCARPLAIGDVASLLRCPDELGPLVYSGGRLVRASADEKECSWLGNRPLLLPRYALDSIEGGALKFSDSAASSPRLQYLLIAAIKASAGPQNLDYSDIWFRRNLHRGRKLFVGASGLTVDIGCDVPRVSRRYYPPEVQFLGVEPSLTASQDFSLCAMAEHLPLKDECADNVVFNASLDHILDYHLAVAEARRILAPGGVLFLNSLVWTRRAELSPDTVHFHHFRDFELQGVLRGLKIESVTRYSWKGDSHRYGVYLAARKPG